jgi:hypothetical protein
MSSARSENELSDADLEELARQRVYAERVAHANARREQELAAGIAQAEDADELALRALLLSALIGAAQESLSLTKELLSARMTVGDLKRPRIGSAPAGRVSYANGSISASVSDMPALVAWVERNYTTELELVTAVRPAFLTAILTASKEAGEPCMPDGTLDVPGVSVRRGNPRIVARPDKARAAELWLEARANPLRLITAQERP